MEMPILEMSTVYAGQNQNSKPRFVKIHTTDNLATVVGAGYLNPYIQSEGLNIVPSDFVFVSASDGHQIYKPTFSGTVITLATLP
jgi:hypothetical protein